jgi:hypothetical protein
MRVLLLDDERFAEDIYWIDFPYHEHEVTIVRNMFEFKHAITSQVWDVISFDNDLGPDQIEGYYLMQRMAMLYMDEKLGYWPEIIICHTMNDIARNNMVEFLKCFGESHLTNLQVITHDR